MWPREPDGFESATVLPQDPPGDEALYFLCFDGQIVAADDNGGRRPVFYRELRWLELEIQFEYYLGQYKNQQCFAAQAAGRVPEGYSLGGLRAWLDTVEPPMFYLAGRALQIMAFHETHRFCGRCGAETEYQAEDNARICSDCSHANYPRLSPSIIVLVSKGDEMLLARNARWPDGLYSTLAGFVEPGESVEQTVHREVREEVGLEVKNLRYVGSQSWPFPNSLMLGFHAEYAGGEVVCQPGEIAEARWFRADQLPGIPPRTAISRWLIDDFIAGRCPKGAD